MSLFRLRECAGIGQSPDSTGNPKKGLYKSGGAEYCQDMDSRFIGAGEDSKTREVNIPSLLAARTAGGNPFPNTLRNGINAPSPSVFKIKDNN